MMEELEPTADAKKIAEMLRQQQMQKIMQSFQANAPMNTDQLNANLQSQEPPMQNSMGSPMYAMGGQMADIPTPQGVPAGFYNPQQTFQQGVKMNPLMIGGSVPMGEGRLHGNVLGTSVQAPGYNRTGINQAGLGYSAPVGGGTLSANVNVPTQGNNYNAMLRYNKAF
jgi:hypothetical protein